MRCATILHQLSTFAKSVDHRSNSSGETLSVDKRTIDVYDQRSADYVDAFAKPEPTSALIDFIDKMPKGGRVLDFGCGPGTHAGVMAAHGLVVKAVDASASMIKLAASQPGVSAIQADFNALNDHQIYDGIWANFSLLHAPHSAFPEHLNQIARALKPQGLLHLGLKTGKGERRDHIGRLYTFYEREELERHLDRAGFDVLNTRTGKSAGLAGTVDPWIELLAKAK